MPYGAGLGCMGDWPVIPGGITGEPIGEHGANLRIPLGAKILFLRVSEAVRIDLGEPPG